MSHFAKRVSDKHLEVNPFFLTEKIVRTFWKVFKTLERVKKPRNKFVGELLCC